MFLCAKIMIRFYRVSLLFELGLSKNFDHVILVYISQELYSLRGSQKEMASNRFLYIAIESCSQSKNLKTPEISTSMRLREEQLWPERFYAG